MKSTSACGCGYEKGILYNLCVASRCRYCLTRTTHVIGACLPSQSASRKHNQEKKPTNLCAPHEFVQKCLPCLIIIQSCYFNYIINKPFKYSRCTISVSCSVHLISTDYVRVGAGWMHQMNLTFKLTLPKDTTVQ